MRATSRDMHGLTPLHLWAAQRVRARAQICAALLPPAQAAELVASALSGKAQVAMARRDWDAAEELLAQAGRGSRASRGSACHACEVDRGWVVLQPCRKWCTACCLPFGCVADARLVTRLQ